MESQVQVQVQDKRMFDYGYDDEDCFGDILNMLDLPVEKVEEDGLVEDWGSKLGPIPSHILPPIQSSCVVSDQPKCRFQAPSPDSVLQRRISFGTQIPVRSRSKRSRSTNPWSRSPLLIPKKKIKVSEVETKKCRHCEVTKTPQWREGPMGPKTLCNACGVRYRSGRLFPEYRPAASPSFIASVHSNSHRKVIEMRQKLKQL